MYDAVLVYCRSFLCTSYCISNYCHSLLDENDAEPCMVKKKMKISTRVNLTILNFCCFKPRGVINRASAHQYFVYLQHKFWRALALLDTPHVGLDASCWSRQITVNHLFFRVQEIFVRDSIIANISHWNQSSIVSGILFSRKSKS